MISTFSLPTQLVIGGGAVERLKTELASRSVTRPLLVTGPVVFRDAVFRRIRGTIERAEIFDEVEPNPTEKNVLDGAEFYVTSGCDGIVAVGGGSVLDAAKAIRLKIHHPLPLADYQSAGPGAGRITAEMPPLIAIPTTAGTGSEANGTTLIRACRAGRKVRIASAHLMPAVALIDAELSLDLPLPVTASSGMTAWTHNVEAYLAPGYHPLRGAMAAEGMRLISSGLPRLLENPRDIEARHDMMVAAVAGALAGQKGPGAASALAHAMTRGAERSHGALLAALLPHVLAALPESQGGPADLAAKSRELASRCGLAPRLRDQGVGEEELEESARVAFRDLAAGPDPAPVSEAALLAACRRAW